MGAGHISFGPFVLDSGARALLSGGKPIAIGQRGYALLEALAGADGNVSKTDLIEAAWPGTIVEEGNLTVQIAALRKALGARPDGGEWIVTVPRVGYRLARSEPQADGEGDLPSIAVMPFQNLTADPEQDYFADGIVVEIITALSRIKRFRVLARNSTFVFKGKAVDIREAARELGARYLVEGTVRRGGGKLRVTAQLVDGENGAHLWAQNFDGVLEGVFEMQDRITANVAALIEPRIQHAEIERAQRRRPGSFTAHDLFLQAVALADMVNPADNRRAIDLLEQVIALDPDHAPALALAGNVMEHRITMGWPDAGPEKAARALGWVKRSLELSSDDAEVLARSGLMLIQLGKDYEGGLAVLRRAVAINPTLPLAAEHLGIALMFDSRFDEAEHWLTEAHRMKIDDPSKIETGLAHIAFCRGEYDKALTLAVRSLSKTPYFNPTHWILIATHVRLGQVDEARRWLRTLLEYAPTLTLAHLHRTHYRTPALDMVFDAMIEAGLPRAQE